MRNIEQQGITVTHLLKGQYKAMSACLQHKTQLPQTFCKAKHSGINCLEEQQGKVGTHSLESQGQELSAALKDSKAQQPHTSWRAKDRDCYQAWNTAMHSSHSQAGKSSTGVVRRLKTQQGTAATHILESQGQGLSAGLKHSKA